MLEKKQFTMSMFVKAEDLYKAKAEYYEQQAEKLQMEVVVLEAKLNTVGDKLDDVNKAMNLPTGANMVKEAFDAEQQ